MAEIYYIKDDKENQKKWAEKIGEPFVNSLEIPSKPVVGSFGVNWDRLQYLDVFGVIAEADALVGAEKESQALGVLQKWAKEKQTAVCIEYIIGYLTAIVTKDEAAAAKILKKASTMNVEYANPFSKLERKALSYAIAQDKSDANARYLLGNYCFRFNKDKAMKLWQAAIELDKNNYLAMRNLAYFMLRGRENLPEVARLYERAVQIKKDCPNLIVEFMSALRLNGELTKALEYLNSLDESLQKDYRVVKARAYILRDNRKFQEALDALLSAEYMYLWEGEIAPRRCYEESLQALGVEAMEKGDFETARKHFEALLEYPRAMLLGKSNNINSSICYYHLGLLSEKMGDSDKAKEYYKTAATQHLPHIHHFESIRENEYYAALAGRKIGDQKICDRVIERFVAMYDDDVYFGFDDLLVFGATYPGYLCAARGFMLKGDPEKAHECLSKLERIYGKCWPFEQAQMELEALEKVPS